MSRLLDAAVARCRAAGLIGPGSELAAVDSTGMEAGHVSAYFGGRPGRKCRRFPKFWAVVDAASHACLAVVPGIGPSPDDGRFHRVAAEAHARHRFRGLAGDCGFDGEHHHAFLYDGLGVLGLIPPERGRPRRRDPDRRGGFHRNFWHQHWAGCKGLYGQRWQVETFFSMLKRLLGSFLRARGWRSQQREMQLKCVTLNLMLVAGKT